MSELGDARAGNAGERVCLGRWRASFDAAAVTGGGGRGSDFERRLPGSTRTFPEIS